MNRRSLITALALSPLMPMAARASPGPGTETIMGMDLASGPDKGVFWLHSEGFLYFNGTEMVELTDPFQHQLS